MGAGHRLFNIIWRRRFDNGLVASQQRVQHALGQRKRLEDKIRSSERWHRLSLLYWRSAGANAEVLIATPKIKHDFNTGEGPSSQWRGCMPAFRVQQQSGTIARPGNRPNCTGVSKSPCTGEADSERNGG